MSFDPDLIDRLALSCLLIEGAESCLAPPPSSIPAGELVQAQTTGPRTSSNPSFTICACFLIRNHQSCWTMKELVLVKHFHSFHSRVRHRVSPVMKIRKTAKGTDSHFSQGREAPQAFALRRQVASRRGPDSAHAWPAGRDRPGRAAYTWRRLPPGQKPPYAPAPASSWQMGGPRTQAAGTVTYGQVWAPRPFQLPAAVLRDLAGQVPRGVSV